MTDLDLAQAASDAYKLTPMWTFNDVHAVKMGDIISFPGTVPTNLEDWLRDFDAVPDYHHLLGWCHRGFLTGGLGLYPLVKSAIDHSTILVGHSLGGALAVIIAALAMLDGIKVSALVTFGAPRCGFHTLVNVVAPIPVRQYHDGNDPVPDVPLGYLHVRTPLIKIGHDELDPINAHMIDKYIAAMT